MSKKDHYNFDLNFLDKDDSKKSKAITKKTESASASKPFRAEWIPLIVVGIVILGGIYVALASSNKPPSTPTYSETREPPVPVSNYESNNVLKTETAIQEPVCNEGFCSTLDGAKCVPRPQHSHCVESRSDIWLCDVGYKEEGDTCLCASENFQCSGVYLTRVNQMDSEFERLKADLESTYVDEYSQYSIDSYNRKREIILQKLKERDQYLEDFCECSL
ncbi:MAG: hypothetical protein PHX87_02625 [Candidatus Peribacteraceae bacterium]|nr:hypothetical protein [Methanocellales archaeon]MDD5742302.1 hypothetical protein [Candidatus Peribacteraceae bacterium]